MRLSGRIVLAVLVLAVLLLPSAPALYPAQAARDAGIVVYGEPPYPRGDSIPASSDEAERRVVALTGPIDRVIDRLVEEGAAEPSSFIVVYGEGVAADRGLLGEVRERIVEAGFRIVKSLDRLGMDVVEVPGAEGSEAYKLLGELLARLGVDARVYPNLRLHLAIAGNFTVLTGQELLEAYGVGVVREGLAASINDPLAEKQWGLWFIGAPAAWEYTMGSPDTVVAVIDSGVFFHPDLVTNLWLNPGEIPFNGVDDDGNGYVDDVVGYDFADQDPYPYDTIGHGTLVAGIIAAAANNSIGVAGVAPKVKVMVLKASPDHSNYLPFDAILDAINYVVTMKERGVDIVAVSASWGTLYAGSPSVVLEYTYPLYQAIETLWQHGILFVAAAGNDWAFTDDDPLFAVPAEYDLPNIVSVGAVDSDGRLAYFSNWGYRSVDLLAPGVDVLSTYAYMDYGFGQDTVSRVYVGYAYGDGTSFSTPHVTSVAALIASLYKSMGITPSNTAAALRLALMLSAVPAPPSLDPELPLASSAGYLNATRAVANVAERPGDIAALLLEPSPLPAPGTSNTSIGLFADTVPAGVEVVFRVLAGSYAGPQNLVVKIFDTSTGTVVGVLHDDGVYPDDYPMDGVYSGTVVIPLSETAAGTVEERAIVVQVFLGGNMVYARDYILKVYNTPLVYDAYVASSFIWAEPPSTAKPSYIAAYEVVNDADAVASTAPPNLFGSNPATWSKQGIAMWPSWMLKIGRTLTGFIGDSADWEFLYEYITLYDPGSMAGIGAVLAPFTTKYIGLDTSFYGYREENPELFTTIIPFKAQIAGDTADVYYVKGYYEAYDPSVGSYKFYPITYEIIAFPNGTVVYSYAYVNITALLAADDYPKAYLSFNRYLHAEYDLVGLAENGIIAGKSIVFRAVPLVTVVKMEWGSVSVSHVPQTIQFTNTYVNPVVVVGPPSYNGPQPAISYVTSVTPTGFTVKVREWDYLDGSHVAERVGYLVVEAGSYTLPDGRKIEAGYVTATSTAWTWVQFQQPFPTAPVVVASIASDTPITVTVRIKGVTSDGFWVRVQPQQSLAGTPVTAKVAWVAVEPGATNVLEAGTAVIPQGSLSTTTITFANAYAAQPTILSAIVTFNGSDPAGLRVKSLTTTSATIMLQEEQSYDQETWHTAETISYIVLPPGQGVLVASSE